VVDGFVLRICTLKKARPCISKAIECSESEDCQPQSKLIDIEYKVFEKLEPTPTNLPNRKRRRKHPLAGLPPEVVKVKRELSRAQRFADIGDLFGELPPDELLTDYQIAEEDFDLFSRIQNKYAGRSGNINRCWNRLQLYLPELISGTCSSASVLEMSTAHGGMLEILRHFGHEVLGNDYANMVSGKQKEERAIFRSVNDGGFKRRTDDYGLAIDESDNVEWPYKPIISAINMPMALFDAGHTPYPFDGKAFDYTICFQAIEHYCHPKDWMVIIDEFCRITRKSIFVMLNPMQKDLMADPDYSEHFNNFRREMRDYNRNGFSCVSTHIHWAQVLGFKLMATGE